MNEDKPPLTHIQLNENVKRLREAAQPLNGNSPGFGAVRILNAFTLLVADLLETLAVEERERAKQALKEQRK